MTAGEALLLALDRAGGETLVLETGARPHVITPGGTVREVGSCEMSAAAMHAIVCELLPERIRLMLYRSHVIVQPLDAGAPGRAVLTAAYVEGRFSLRLERRTSSPPRH